MTSILILSKIIAILIVAPLLFYYGVKQKNNILTVTRYGDYEFCSSILKGNVFACQFHPEKSGPRGLNIFRNFFN